MRVGLLLDLALFALLLLHKTALQTWGRWRPALRADPLTAVVATNQAAAKESCSEPAWVDGERFSTTALHGC